LAEIGFYHLTRSPLLRALPTLLGRTLAAGERAYILCPDPALLSTIDAALWASTDPAWLPHGGPAEGDADLQPIWLDPGDAAPGGAPNGARYLFLVGGASSERLAAFSRVFDLFDGGDAGAVAAARDRWRAARAAGHTLDYWQQTDRGWTRKRA
jgi:DNA polymerase-3 subunit chi